jgi:hypothetical protein
VTDLALLPATTSGHVECLESGVFRADIPCKFNLKPAALQKLIDEVDADLEYALRTEAKLAPEDVSSASLLPTPEGAQCANTHPPCPSFCRLRRHPGGHRGQAGEPEDGAQA